LFPSRIKLLKKSKSRLVSLEYSTYTSHALLQACVLVLSWQ
jgi:hypothetical protein